MACPRKQLIWKQRLRGVYNVFLSVGIRAVWCKGCGFFGFVARSVHGISSLFRLCPMTNIRFDLGLGSKFGTELWIFNDRCCYWCLDFAGPCVGTSLFGFFHICSSSGEISSPLPRIPQSVLVKNLLYEQLDSTILFVSWDKHWFLSP